MIYKDRATICLVGAHDARASAQLLWWLARLADGASTWQLALSEESEVRASLYALVPDALTIQEVAAHLEGSSAQPMLARYLDARAAVETAERSYRTLLETAAGAAVLRDETLDLPTRIRRAVEGMIVDLPPGSRRSRRGRR